MDWLNYHHLHYFWLVAREGSISQAGARLRLAPSTISAQIRQLEAELGAPLFVRAGRRLELTEAGRTAYRYAERIFALGRELADNVRAGDARPTLRLVVGIADVLPKLVAYRILEPALRISEPVRLVCREGRPERLAVDLSIDEIDLLLSDAPVASSPRAFNHLLGECGVSFFALPAVAAARRPSFPRSLAGAPFLLPLENTSLRRGLDRWFEREGIVPAVVAEFEDGALLSVFGQYGGGIFASPTVIEAEIAAASGVELLGRVEDIRVRFYAVSSDRQTHNPAIAAILDAARRDLFP